MRLQYWGTGPPPAARLSGRCAAQVGGCHAVTQSHRQHCAGNGDIVTTCINPTDPGLPGEVGTVPAPPSEEDGLATLSRRSLCIEVADADGDEDFLSPEGSSRQQCAC